MRVTSSELLGSRADIKAFPDKDRWRRLNMLENQPFPTRSGRSISQPGPNPEPLPVLENAEQLHSGSTQPKATEEARSVFLWECIG